MKENKKKLFIVGIFLSSFIIGIFWRPPDAVAYQVKRVLNGSTSLPVNIEAISVDLSTVFPTNWEDMDTTKSFLLFTIAPAYTGQGTNRDNLQTYVNVIGLIDDPKTVTFTRRSAADRNSIDINYTVIEFKSGATVLSGMTTINENTTVKNIVFPGSGVTLGKAIPIISCRPFSSNNALEYRNIFRAELTSATNLQLTRSESTSYNVDVAYQVLSFDSTESGVAVQSNTVTIDNSGAVANKEDSDNNLTLVAIVANDVDVSKSLLFFTTSPSTTTIGQECSYAVDGQLTSKNRITFNRTDSTGTVAITWYLLEFKNNVLVQRNRLTNQAAASAAVAVGTTSGYGESTYSPLGITNISVSGGPTVASGNAATGLDDVLWRSQFAAAAGTPPVHSTVNLNRESNGTVQATNISWEVGAFPLLNLTYPNGGEIGADALFVGNKVTIKWEHAKILETANGGNPVKVKLLLDKNSGNDGFPLTIKTGLNANLDQWDWNPVDAALSGTSTIGNKLRVRIVCEDTYTDSAAVNINTASDVTPITITTAANHGLNSGQRVRISGNSIAALNKEWIITWTGNTTFTLNGSTASGAGTGGTVAAVKRNYDDSNADFEIKGKIEVTAPDSAVNSTNPWYVTDANKEIKWKPYGNLNAGTFGTVRIDFSYDNGVTWNTIADNIAAGADQVTQTWPWPTIPTSLGGKTTIGINNKIRVSLNSCETYLGIVSSTNTAPIKITTAAAHNYSTGQRVTISGNSVSAVNGNWVITVVDSTSFTLDGSSAPGAAGSGGTVIDSAVSIASSTDATPIQITTSVAHGYSTGDKVNISGHDKAAVNGTWVITKVDATKFTLDGSTTHGGGAGSGGSAKKQIVDSVISGTSAAFCIKGKISNVRVTDPSTGNPVTSCLIGSHYNIKWDKKGYFASDGDGTVNIKYSSNGGGSFPTLVTLTPCSAGTDAAGGTYDWDTTGLAETTDNNSQVLVESNNTEALVRVSLASSGFNMGKGTLDLAALPGPYTVGQSMPISWTASPNLTLIDIYFSTDNGGNWTMIKSGVAASAGGYPWTVGNNSSGGLLTDSPVTAANQGKIKIIDQLYSITKISGGFTVQGSIDVTAPIGGAVWKIGEPNKTIDWNQTGTFDKVKISVSRNNGGTWTTIDDDVNPATEKPYSWSEVLTPASATNEALIKVEHWKWSSISDVSAGFTIQQTIHVDEPNAADTVWRVGTTPTVRWTLQGTVNKVDILYKKGASGTPTRLTPAAGVTADSGGGSGSWAFSPADPLIPNVPDDISDEDVYIIVRDHDHTYIQDENEIPIKIKGAITVAAIGGANATVLVEESLNIFFSVKGSVGSPAQPKTAQAWIYKDGSYTAITGATTSVTGENPSYSIPWTVAAADRGAARNIKVAIQGEESLIIGTANVSNDFTIEPRITLTNPPPNQSNPKLSYNMNTDLYVQWTTSPADTNFGNVEIKYSKDDGPYVGTVTTSAIPSNNKVTVPGVGEVIGFKWTLNNENACGTNIKIKIYQVGKTDIVFSNSNFGFEILGSIFLTGEAKNQDDTTVWEMGTPNAIAWQRTGDIGKVDILYSKSSGSPAYNYYVVRNLDVSAINSYPWTIRYSNAETLPDGYVDFEKSEYIRLKIKSSTSENISDVSANTITVKSKIEVEKPTGQDPILKIYAGSGDEAVIDWFTSSTCTDCVPPASSIPTIHIKYNTNGGTGPYTPIESGFPNPVSGLYSWHVADDVPIGKNLVVRVSSALYDDIAGVSATSFRVLGQIKINAPVGVKDATAWTVNNPTHGFPNTKSITWTNYGNLLSGVSILYSAINDFVTEGNYQVLDSNASGVTGQHSIDFVVPDNIGTSNRIKIIDNIADADIRAEAALSEAFDIKGKLQLLEPAGGESGYDMGQEIDVKWKYSGDLSKSGNLNLYYRRYDEANQPIEDWQKINQAGVVAYNRLEDANHICHYTWPAPALHSTRYKLKIEAANDPYVVAMTGDGGSYFAIRGGVTLNSPGKKPPEQATEKWYVDDQVANIITWTPQGQIPKVDLYIVPDSDDLNTEYLIEAGVLAVPSTYTWKMTEESMRRLATSDQARIRIYVNGEPTKSDTSTRDFFIKPRLTITPLVGTPWKVEDERTIAWTKTGKIDNVKVIFNNGTQTETLGNPTGETGSSINWIIDPESGIQKVTTSATIKVVRFDGGVEDNDVTSTSDPSFTIDGNIKNVQTGATTLYAGQPGATISWQIKGTVGDMQLKYSIDAANNYPDASFNPVPGSETIPAGTTNTTFTTPMDVGSVKFRLIEKLKSTRVFSNSGVCTIKGSLQLEAASTESQNLTVGTEHTIRWSTNGTFQALEAFYIIDGVKKSIPGAIGPGVTSIKWTPGEGDISNNIIFRVEDPNERSNGDETPADKKNTVAGIMEVRSPTNSVNNELVVGQTGEFIKWFKQGDFGQLHIELYNSDNTLVPDAESNLTLAQVDDGNPGVENHFDWTVPDKIGKQHVKIRITPQNHAADYTRESVLFSIKGGFVANSVSSPSSGGTWWVGSGSKNITWQAKGTMTNLRIELSVTGSPSREWLTTPIADGITPVKIGPDTYQYSWAFDPALQNNIADQRSNDCKIQIIDKDNTSSVLESNGTFTIKPEIVPVTPAQAWVAKTYPQISWNTIQGQQTQTIDIILDNDGDGFGDGGDQVLTPANGIAANTAVPYTSTVQLSGKITTAASIRIQDHNKPTLVYGDTASTFEIKGEMTVSCVNTPWTYQDTNKDITWQFKGDVSTVNILVDYDGDKDFNDVAALQGGISATSGYDPVVPGQGKWTWPSIPDKVSNNVWIRVEAVGTPQPLYGDFGNFSILGKIDVTSPNGAPVHIEDDQSESISIKWKTWGTDITKVKLAYSLNGLDPYTTIDANVSNTGDGVTENSWLWNKTKTITIPRDQSSLNMKIRVSASTPDQPATKDESSAFMLCGSIYPDAIADPVWEADGTTANAISWKIAGQIDTVAIYYAPDGLNFGATPIIPSTDAHNGTHNGDGTALGSCTWTVPATVGANDNWLSNGAVAKVRIEDTREFFNVSVVDTSVPFTVKGILNFSAATLTDLSSGLTAGVQKAITIERKGKINEMQLRYSRDNGGSFPDPYIIASNITFAAGAFIKNVNWTPPENVGAQSKGNGYALRVIDTANPDTDYAVVSPVFTVKSETKYTGPTPTTLYIGNSPTITWDILHGLDIDFVKVIGSRSGNFDDQGVPGSDMFVINGQTDANNAGPTSGSCTWNIQELTPSILTNTLKIKILNYDSAYGTGEGLLSTSGAFTIKGALTVDKPTEDWNVGDINRLIIWKPQGNITKFKIYFSSQNGDAGTWSPVTPPEGTSGTDYAGGKKSFSTANWYHTDGLTGVIDVKSKNCKLKVCDFNNEDEVFAVTPDVDKFNVYPKITNVVIVPSVGDEASNPVIWRADKSGTQLKFTVPSKDTITKVDIYYSPNGVANLGATAFLPEVSVTANGENTVTFTSPTELSIGANALIRIKDNNSNFSSLISADSSVFRVVRWIEIDNNYFIQDWKVGETDKKVYWTAHGTQTGGTNNNVKIWFNNGSGYPETALATVGADSSPWTWLPQVPDDVTINAHFKITDADSSREAYTQYESAQFKIAGVLSNLTVAPFNTGEEDAPVAGLFEGTKISWNRVGNAIQNVRLEYNNNNKNPANWVSLPPEDLIPAGTFYKWTPPAADIKDNICFIRITDPANSGTTLTSGSFSVKSKVKVSEPNGTVPLEVGKPVTVKWSKWGTFDNVNIYYRALPTDDWGLPIATGASHIVGNENYGELTFDLPTDTKLAVGTAQMKVEDAAKPNLCIAVPSASFSTIGSVQVLKPDNSERYIAGKAITIRWKRIGTVPAVDVYYSKDGGLTWGEGTAQRIDANDPFPDSPASDFDEISWIPPEEIGEYMIEVRDSTPLSTIKNRSPKFTVGGELKITKPDLPGVSYEVGLAGQTIEWNIEHGNIPFVKIIGSRSGSFSGQNDMFEITAQTQADNVLTFNKDNPVPKGKGSFTWNFPEKNPSICSNAAAIRVMDYDTVKYPLVLDDPSNPCAIKPRFVFYQTPPATPVQCDKSFNIQWYTYGNVSAVQLKYRPDSLSAYTPIPSGAISNNKGTEAGAQLTTFSWAPDGEDVGVCSEAQIQILQTDPQGQNISLESSPFAIGGWFEFQEGDLPAEGDSWEIQPSAPGHLIHWTNHGVETPIMVQYWDGTSYQDITPGGTATNTGFYNWSPGASTKLTPYCKIRVGKFGAMETNSDESGEFSLHGKVKFTTDPTDPVDGKYFKFGKGYPIEFGVEKGQNMKVRVDYSVVSGVPQPSDFTHTIVSNVSLNAGESSSYTWNISEASGDVQSTSVVLRVCDMNDAAHCNATTSLAQRFRIQCTFDVTKPDGNIPWQVGDPGLIEWKSLAGTCNYVNVWYCTNSNDPDPLNWNWTKLNTSQVDNRPVGQLHTFTWPMVQNPRSNYCRVKVSDTRDDLAAAISEDQEEFAIRGSININDPNTHKDLDIGSSHTIKWEQDGDIQKLNIYYNVLGTYAFDGNLPGNPIKSLDESSAVPQDKISYYYNATSGQYEYPWSPIPNKPHNNVYVVVINPDESTESDISSDHSTIRAVLQIDDFDPLLRVLDQSDPECVPELITWSLQGTITNVKLEYSLDNFGSDIHEIVAAYSATSRPTGTPVGKYGYEWYIPKGAMCKTDADRVRVRISSSDQLNEPSNAPVSNPFVVKGSVEMLHPHTGEMLSVDDNTYNIEWKTMGDLNTITNAKLRLWLSVVGQPEHTPTIITSIADPGSHNTKPTFTWPSVPDLIHNDLVIIKGVLLVNGVEDQEISDETSAFTIRAKLKVLFPNGPTDYIIHQKANQYITWEKHGTLNTNTVDIDLINTAGTKIADIADNVSAAGSYPWSNLVPADLVGDDFKIKVTDHALNAEHDGANCKTETGESADAFKIRGSLTFVAGTVPVNDQVWMIGEDKTVQWNVVGPINTVILEYSTDGNNYSYITDVNGNPISELPAIPSSFTWKVPQAARGTTCKLRIREKRAAIDVYDIKPSGEDTFIIRGGFTWQQPPKTAYALRETMPLAWATFGGMQFVKLEFSPNNNDWYPVKNQALIPNSGGIGDVYMWFLDPAKTGMGTAYPMYIRVQDPDDQDAKAVLTVKVKGKLDFTAPTASTTWKAGEPHTISWTKEGDIGLVLVDYVKSGGGGGSINSNGVVADKGDGTGSCNWDVPPEAVGTVNIVLTLKSDPTITWESAQFPVEANFVFDAPTGSTIWYVDDPENIIWTTYGDVTKVNLRYWSKLNTWEPITSNLDNNIIGDRKTTFQWPHVPDNIADNVKIEVKDAGTSGTVAESYPFKIRGLITLNEPTEPLKIGEPYTISWTEKGHAAQVEIWFDSGVGETQLNNGQPIDNLTKSYPWTAVSDVLLPCEQARFRIKTVGYDIQDSTEYFKVVPDFDFVKPGPNDIFKINDPVDNTTIKWTCTSTHAPWVSLEYSLDGNNFNPITTEDVPNPTTLGVQGQYPWQLTSAQNCSSTAYIRITTKIGGGATVQGQTKSSKFYLRPVFNLQVPNGSEKFVVGKDNKIRWTCAGRLTPVKLMYSASGNFDDTQALPNVPPLPAVADGLVSNTQIPPAVNEFAWNIPDGLFSDTARLRITATDEINGKDDSEGTFMIVAGFDIDSPLEDQEYEVGGSIPITWRCTSSGANVPKVNLAYSLENGAEGSYHIFEYNLNNPANAGDPAQFNWNNIAENMISKNVKIKVIDAGDSDGFQESGRFVIKADLDFVQPGGSANQTLTVGDPLELQWKCKGDVSTVKFQYSFDNTDPDSWVDIPGAESVANPAPDGLGIRRFSVPGGVPSIIGQQVWFRVADNVSGHPESYAETVNHFRVKGAINITSPRNALPVPPDENKLAMEIGKPFDITWTMKGVIPQVIIDYCDDNGVFNPVPAWPDPGAHTFPIATIDTEDYLQPDGTYKYTWPQVPDNTNGQSFIRIRDSRTVDYPEVVSISDIFRIKGYVQVIWPNGDEEWQAKDNTKSIRWQWGGTLNEMVITLSKVGSAGPYDVSIATVNTSAYSGGGTITLPWEVSDAISGDCWIKVAYSGDAGVYDISDKKFTIYGGLQLNAPTNANRWVAREDHEISWTTKGTIPTVKLEYLKYNADGSPKVVLDGEGNVIDDGIEVIDDAAPNTGEDLGRYLWSLPNDRCDYVKVRISDPRDPNRVVALSNGYFKIDYYTVQFYIRDLITDSALSTLSVSGSSNKGSPVDTWKTTWMPGTEDDENPIPLGCSLGVPIEVDLPAGSWRLIWSKTSYSDVQVNFSLTKDLILDMPPESNPANLWNEEGQGNIHMETTAVHIWRAYSDFSYAPDPDGIGPLTDSISVSSWLERDGFVVSGGQKVDVYIYDGATQIRHLEAPGADAVGAENPDDAGFFHMIWENTGLQEGKVYTVIADITNAAGKHFKTPTSFSITEAKKLQETQDTVKDVLQVQLPQMIAGPNVTAQEIISGGGIKGVITQKLDEQTGLIIGPGRTKDDIMAAGGMVGMLQNSLTAFEKNATLAIEDLQAGADKAVLAGEELEATAKKFSWNANAAPDPALSGDMITLQVQGQPGLLPMLNIYSWDNRQLVTDVIMTETRPGFYVYEFTADVTRFTPGKAYTYLVTEQITDGVVSGSGMVESMGISTVAGLAAAAPEAERAAKKALDAIKAVESVLISSENINIALTLKNLKESVEELPDILNKEGPNAQLIGAINEISDRIKTFVGKEGVDLGTLLDEKLGDESTLKDVRNKTDTINAIVDMLLQIIEGKLGGVDSPIISTSLQAGSVKFRIVAVNPSKTRTQKIQVRKYLPEEVKPKDVMELGDLELEFDAERSIYYVYRNDVELRPGEARVFEVEVEDIWMIPQSQLADIKNQSNEMLSRFQKSPYLAKAKEVIEPIGPLLDEMAKAQVDDAISRERHIGIYRQNLQNIRTIQERLAELDKMLEPPKGVKTPDLLEKKLKINLPSKTTTWLIIMVVIAFLGLLAGIFFFVWQGQIRSSQNMIDEARKSSFPKSDKEEPKK